jgi:hypothetical protein
MATFIDPISTRWSTNALKRHPLAAVIGASPVTAIDVGSRGGFDQALASSSGQRNDARSVAVGG